MPDTADLNDNGYVLWGAEMTARRVGELREELREIFPERTTAELNRLMLDHFVPDHGYTAEGPEGPPTLPEELARRAYYFPSEPPWRART